VLKKKKKKDRERKDRNKIINMQRKEELFRQINIIQLKQRNTIRERKRKKNKNGGGM
jgi:hypothetical protein